MKWIAIVAVILTGIIGYVLFGQKPQDTNPPLPTSTETSQSTIPASVTISSSEFPASLDTTNARIVDRIELPAGGDIISALKKMGGKVFIPEPRKVQTTAPYKVALNMGIAVAGGLASIAEKDKPKLEKYADMIYEYANVLHVQDSLLTHYKKVKDALAKNDWSEVEQLVSLLQDDAVVELNKGYRKDEARLALVGGWLEGFHIVGKTLESSFNKEVASELLPYQDLPQYLDEQIKALNPKTKEKPEVVAVIETLKKIDSVVNKPATYSFSSKDVNQLLNVTRPFRTTVMAS